MYQNIPINTMENGHEEQYDQEQLVSMIHRLVDERDGLWRENEYLKSKLNESILIETINDMRRERELLFKLLLNLSNQNRDEQPQPQPTHHSNHHHHHHTEEHMNGYTHDLLPPPPYQTYNTTPNGKSSQAKNSPSVKKHSTHTRPHRDLSIPVTELKPTRRAPRTTKSSFDAAQLPPQPTVVYRVEGTKECLMNPDELSSVFAHVKHSHPNKKIVVYKTPTTPQTHEFNQLMDEMCVRHGVELKHSQNSPFQQYRSQSLQDLTKPQQRDFDFQFQTIEKQEQKRGIYTKNGGNNHK